MKIKHFLMISLCFSTIALYSMPKRPIEYVSSDSDSNNSDSEGTESTKKSCTIAKMTEQQTLSNDFDSLLESIHNKCSVDTPKNTTPIDALFKAAIQNNHVEINNICSSLPEKEGMMVITDVLEQIKKDKQTNPMTYFYENRTITLLRQKALQLFHAL